MRTYFGRQPFEDFDPDVFKQRKGFDVYEKMLRDPQVKAVFNLKRDLLISRKWSFERPDDTLRQKRLEEFLTWNLEHVLQGAWLDALRAVLMSWANGYSVTEKVYKPVVWDRLDKWAIGSMKLRPSSTITFKRDAFGNITELIQWQAGEKRELDPRKFIIHLANPELDPIYGVSELQAAYRPYWEKDVITKFHNIYLERMAAGFLWVSLEKPLGSQEETDLRNIIKNLSPHSGVVAPAGAKAEVIQSVTTDAFERALIQRNQEIAKALGVPSLLGLTEQGRVGSFAQAKIQVDHFFLQLEREGQALAETLNEHLFKDLAVWNFGTEEHPRLKFDPFTDDQKQGFVKAWGQAVKDGTVIPTKADEKRIRELLGFPIITEQMNGLGEPLPLRQAPQQQQRPQPTREGSVNDDANEWLIS